MCDLVMSNSVLLNLVEGIGQCILSFIHDTVSDYNRVISRQLDGSSVCHMMSLFALRKLALCPWQHTLRRWAVPAV